MDQQQSGWPAWPAMWPGGPRWSLKRMALVWGALALLAIPSLAATLITGGLIAAWAMWTSVRAVRGRFTAPYAPPERLTDLPDARDAGGDTHGANEDGE